MTVLLMMLGALAMLPVGMELMRRLADPIYDRWGVSGGYVSLYLVGSAPSVLYVLACSLVAVRA